MLTNVTKELRNTFTVYGWVMGFTDLATATYNGAQKDIAEGNGTYWNTIDGACSSALGWITGDICAKEGAIKGAEIGAAIGTAVGGKPGTVTGGVIGAFVGGVAGNYAGSKLGEAGGHKAVETIRNW